MAPLGGRVIQLKERRTALRKRRSRWLVRNLERNGDIVSENKTMMKRLSRVGGDDRDSFISLDSEMQSGMVEVKFEDPWVPMTGRHSKLHSANDLLEPSEDQSGSPEKSLLQLASSPHLNSEDNQDDEDPISEIRTYKRRFYMLFLFSIIGFSQYCAWNTFGPIATTAKAVFGWTNTEIAFLASMDPITYLFTMLFFSWMMDVKGLRLSMLVSTVFMFLGTGLRCVTYDSSYAVWSMGGGQFLNGLAGPVTQAAPPLLSASWFPSHQRTTATAVAALCGSMGVAMSFILGPCLVRDVKTELENLMPKPLNQSSNISFAITRYLDRSLPLQDSVYLDAVHYWPLDELNITLHDSPAVPAFQRTQHNSRLGSNSIIKSESSTQYWRTTVLTNVRDLKSDQQGLAFGRVRTGLGILNDSVITNGEDAWIKLGHFINTCLGEPSLCYDGLTVSFWIKYFKPIGDMQYFMGTSGSREGYRGFLIYQNFNIDSEDHLIVKVENSTMLWQQSFFAPRDSWLHVTFTWDSREGLLIYANGSLVVGDNVGQMTDPINPYYTTLTLGKANDRFMCSNASFDEVAVWYRKLHPLEIEAIHKRFVEPEKESEQETFEKAKEKIIKDGKQQIMTLLYIEFGVVTILFLAVLIYFPDKPPTPPSHSARIKREDFFAGGKQIAKNPQFWTLAFVYGVTTGVYSGWGASLAVNLETFNISQNEAGWLGFYATLAGIGAGLILARCADLFGGRMKVLLLVLFFGSAGCFLWFSLLCLRIIPFDNDSLYKSSILGGFFVSGTIPLFYELTVESTYPVAEGVTIGVLTLVNNFFTVAFLVILTVPGVGTVWMNWCMFGACAGCIPIMLAFREKYRRLKIDNAPLTNGSKEPKKTESFKAIKTPLGSLLSVFHLDEVVHKIRKCKESDI